MRKLNPVFFVAAAFAALLGYLLGDVRGALIGLCVFLGIALMGEIL